VRLVRLRIQVLRVFKVHKAIVVMQALRSGRVPKVHRVLQVYKVQPVLKVQADRLQAQVQQVPRVLRVILETQVPKV
jgi:hypothetical protein